MTDERGFADASKSIDALSMDELRSMNRELAIENSKLSTKVRVLEIENRQIRNLADDSGFTHDAISKIRSSVLTAYLSNLEPIKKKRGAPRSLKNDFFIAELWREYTLLEDKSISLKAWLRKLIEADYKQYNASLVARKKEIDNRVGQFATAITRYKQSLVLHN